MWPSRNTEFFDNCRISTHCRTVYHNRILFSRKIFIQDFSRFHCPFPFIKILFMSEIISKLLKNLKRNWLYRHSFPSFLMIFEITSSIFIHESSFYKNRLLTGIALNDPYCHFCGFLSGFFCCLIMIKYFCIDGGIFFLAIPDIPYIGNTYRPGKIRFIL